MSSFRRGDARHLFARRRHLPHMRQKRAPHSPMQVQPPSNQASLPASVFVTGDRGSIAPKNGESEPEDMHLLERLGRPRYSLLPWRPPLSTFAPSAWPMTTTRSHGVAQLSQAHPLPQPDHSSIRERVITPYSPDAFDFFLDKHNISHLHSDLVQKLRNGFPMGDFPTSSAHRHFPEQNFFPRAQGLHRQLPTGGS